MTQVITHIIHIADLHIRAGDTAKSRYSEYEIVMNRIIEDMSLYKPILNKQAIIVIAGDIFHHKLKIESPGLKLSLQFISGLAKLCEVYIIRGNHDYKQAYPDEPDLIESLLSVDIPNVTYLNKTGHYKVHNIGFGLVSIQDALFSGNTQGITPDLPEFPDPSFFDDSSNIQHKIALFHGPVSKTRLPNGMEIMENHSYPIEWFKGYDSIMLGDIHLQQVNNSKRIDIIPNKFKHSIMIDNHILTNKLMWSYPGSTIQQDFGETLIGHGFLIWDLPNKNIQCYHTPNDYGYVTVKKYNAEWLINMKTQIENKWVSLQQIVSESWFPKNIYLRIKVFTKKQDFSISNEIYTLFQQYNINIIEIRQDIGNNNILENNKNNADEHYEIIDLVSFNTPNVWAEYLQDKIIKNNTSDWRPWLINKDLMKLPNINNNMNKVIIDKINDKNVKFTKYIDDYSVGKNSKCNLFTIKKSFVFNYIQWDYILCFRNNNHFNFDNLENNINSITAKNAQGKTSFLETICIALFGEGFPSRHNKVYSSSIICQEKPSSENAKTIIHLTINNIKYIITRVFDTVSSDINKIMCQSNYTTLNMIENDNIINIHTGKTAVDTWVDTNIGNIKSFLLSCMISQNVDMDFFGLKSADQKALLDNALCINTSTQFHMLLKEAKLHHSSLIDTVKTVMASFTNNTKFENYPQKIRDIKKIIEDDIKHKDIITISHDKFYKKVNDNKLIDTSLFKLGKNKLVTKISDFETEYESISSNLVDKDINTITLEIGAYNNHLKSIGVENIIKKHKKDDISKNIIATKNKLQAIQKPNISYDDIIAQINLYGLLLNKHRLEFGKHGKSENTIESIQNYITQNKLQINDITEAITQSQFDIDIYKQELTELLKSQPIHPTTSVDEFEEYKNNIITLENKYSQSSNAKHDSTYENLIAILEELQKLSIDKPSIELNTIYEKSIDISSYDTLKKQFQDTIKKISNITDLIQQYTKEFNGYQLEYNNTIKSQPLQSKSTHDEYLQWKKSFDIIKDKYTSFQDPHSGELRDLQTQYNNITDIFIPNFPKNKIDKELNILKKSLSKFKNLNLNYQDDDIDNKIKEKQKQYDDINNKLKLLQSNIDDYNIKHINSLTNKPPTSTDDYKLLDKQYNKFNTILQNSKLSTDIDAIQSIISKIIEYNNIIKDTQKRFNEHQQILLSIEDHPYNPDCWACQKQPWKLHKDLINNTINDLNKVILQTTKKINKYESLETLQAHIENIKKFKDIEAKKIIAYDYLQWKNTHDSIITELESNKQLYLTTSTTLNNILNDIKQYQEFYDINIKIDNYNKDILTWQIKSQYDTITNDFNIWKLHDYWTEDYEKYIQFELWKKKIAILEQNIQDASNIISENKIKLENLVYIKNNIDNDILAIEWIKYNNYYLKYQDIYNDKVKWKKLIDTKDFWTQEQQKIENINQWKNDINDIEEKIAYEQNKFKLYDTQFKNISQSLLELEDLHKFKLQEQDFIDKISILENYKNTWKYIQLLEDDLSLYNKLIESWDIIDKINTSQNIINNIKRSLELQNILKHYQTSYHLWDEWKFVEDNYKLIKDIDATINKKQLELSLLQHELDNYKNTLSSLQLHKDYLEILESRFEMLNSLYNEFSGFTTWLYTEKVIPSLVYSVNTIIKDICDNRPLFIQCTVNKSAIGSISFDWFLKDGLSAPPIEKASGFQKFIVGIAIRIALGSLGASGIKPTQLFIDEGFNSADVDNLAKVNDFLDSLLLRYKQIIIVSHLQDLNDCAKKHIFIKRYITETTSQLQFGDKNSHDNFKKVKKTPAKLSSEATPPKQICVTTPKTTKKIEAEPLKKKVVIKK